MVDVVGSYENEDLRPPTKTKTHYENGDSPTKTKTNYENEDPTRKRQRTKIMFMRHTTKTKILTEILNSEFGTSVIYYGIFQQ